MKFFDCKRFAGVFMLLLAITCGGCIGDSGKSQKKPVTSIQQLNDPAYTIAVAGSGPAYEAVKRELPKAKNLYMNAQPAYDAVKSGKADAYVEAIVQVETAMANGLSGVKILPGKIGDPIKIAIGISKNAKYPGLKDKLNAFIAEVQADGTFQALYQRWIIDNNHTMPDIPVPEKADTKLVVGTTGLLMPFSYYEGTTLTGTDVEIARRLARWLGAELEFKLYDYEGLITAAIVGDVDCVMSNLFVTPERAEKIDFSDTLYSEDIVILVKDDAPASESVASEHKGYSSISDFNGKRIGVFTGSIHDQIVQEVLPDAERVYFDGAGNAVIALNSGKIDAMTFDAQMARDVVQTNSTVRCFDEYLSSFDNAFIVAKSPEGDKIRAQLDEFIRSIKADGTRENILSVWTGTDESVKTLPDYEKYPDTNGTIRIAAEIETPPFTYIKYGRPVGYEIDIITRFCKAYGYRPSIDEISFPAILPAVKSGKYMIGIASFTITEERKESVNFTEPTYTGGSILVIRNTPQSQANPTTTSTLHNHATSPAKYTSLADLRGKKIGIQTGVDSWARLVKELIPDAEVLFFNDITSLAAALESRKIDAFLEGNVAMAMLMAVNKNITVLNENIAQGYSSAVALRRDAKGEKLKVQWDEYITALKSAGKIDALMDKWTGTDEGAKTLPDYESLPAPNGVLVMASDGNYPPLSYYSGNKLVGFEMDLAAGFCERYGYGLKILLMSYPGMLPALATGKCDFSIAGASLTEEHKETLTLSVPYYTYTTKVAVLAENVSAAAEANNDSEKYAALADLNGKRIGVPTGVDEWVVILSKILPDAELVYYNSTADQIAALESGKIEAFPCDEPVLKYLMALNKNIAMLDEDFPEGYDAGVVFPQTEKGRKLKAQWDEYITSLKNAGKLEALVQKWTGEDESAKTIPDYESLSSPNGVLRTATNGDYPPFNYFQNNKLAGLDVDLAVGFCRAYGYGLEYKIVNYDGILPSVQSGKSDFALAALSLTEEHAEKMLFSVPYYTFTTNIAVLASHKAAPTNVIHSAEDPRIVPLNGKRIGVITGVDIWAQIVHRLLPDSEIAYYNEFADMVLAMSSGKISAFVCDVPVLHALMRENKNIAPLNALLEESVDIAVGFPPQAEKSLKLKSQWDEFITSLKNTGELDSIINRWTSSENPQEGMPDYESLTATNGVLTMATDGANPPLSYYIGNKLGGFETELAVRFCAAYGYGLNFKVMAYDAVIAALQSEKCDFALADLPPTDEHAENLLFSLPYHASANTLAVPADSPLAAKPAPKTPEMPASSRARLSSFKDLAGKKIAVTTGTTHASIALQYVPDANLMYFQTTPDTFAALKTMKVDAVCTALEMAQAAMAEDDSLTLFGEQLTHVDIAPIFSKKDNGRKLCDQFSEFVKPLWDDGTIDAVYAKWFGPDESKKTIKDYSKLPAPNGTLKLAVDPDYYPIVYVKDNKIVGYDVDLIIMFCERYGYGLEIVQMHFSGIIPAVQSGKCDLGAGGFTITEERKESVLFSYPFMRSGNVFVVRKADIQPASQAISTQAQAVSTQSTAQTVSTPSPQKSAAKSGASTLKLKDLNGKKVGIILGANHDIFVAEKIPDAKIEYFSDLSTVTLALRNEKISAFANTLPTAIYMTTAQKDLAYISEPLESTNTYSSFTSSERGRKLCKEYEEFLRTLWDNGTIDRLADKWVYSDNEDARTIEDYSKLPDVNGVLKMAIDTGRMPFAYVKENRITGYDIELATMFCKAKGYRLEVYSMDFAGILGSIKTGKCDLTGSITWTEERAETMLYSSVPNAQTDIVLIVMNTQSPAQESAPEISSGMYATIHDLAGKKVAVQTGTIAPQIVSEFIPTAERVYFETQTDMVTALRTEKVDAFCTDIPIGKAMTSEYSGMTMLGAPLTDDKCAPIFAKTEKGRKLCGQFSEFAKSCWENGTIQELESIWYGADNSRKVVKDYSKLPAPNGKLRMAADPACMPFAYMKGNRIVGYDVDFVVRFCEAYGYGLEIATMNFGAMIPAVLSGRCDFAACNVTITEERAESVLFADPNMTSGMGLFVRKSDTQTQAASPRGKHTSIQELAGKKIGVMTGTTNDALVAESIPTAAREYFNTLPDALIALKTGKVDAICCSVYAARYMMIENDDIMYIEPMLKSLELAPIFSPTEKGRNLREEYSEFVKGLWSDGTIREIDSVWLGKDDTKRVLKDYSKLPAPNGILRMAAEPTDIPFVYMKDNQFVGYDVDIAVRFCEAHGYGLEVVPMAFPAVIPSINSSKTDFSASMHITPEREQSALFSSVPTAHSGNVIVVMKAQPAQSEGEYSSFEELAGKNIGAQTGTPNGDFTLKAIPTANVQYFDSVADIVTALKMRKIDAGAIALNAARFMMIDNEDLALMGKPLAELDAAPIFAKTEAGKKLCEQFNEFIKAQWDNGYLQELDSIWFSRDDSKRQPTDYASLPATNGTLRMAVDLSLAPFAYVKDNRIVGYEIDFAAKFCKEYGYGLEIMPMSFGAIIAAVQSGKCDFASCTIAITPERAEQVLFASPNAKTGCALVIRKAAPKTQPRMSSELSAKLKELAGKRIGVQSGTRSPEIVKEFIPEAVRVYYDSPADNLIALRTGKIDAVSMADQTARIMMTDNKDIAFFCDRLTNTELRAIFPKTEKGRRLCEEYSEFVKGLWDDGTISEIDSVWIGNDESKKVVRNYTKFPVITPKGTLRMAVDSGMMPFNYVKDNKIIGYDIDIAVRFCEAKGYGLEVIPMNFAAIIPSVNTSKCDFSLGMAYTPERAENVLFASTPNATTGTYIVVMKDTVQTAPAAASRTPVVTPATPAKLDESPAKPQANAFMSEASVFFEELKASFNRTFIREERWRLFVEGIINTMIITVLSIVCGTILGFVVYLFCRGGNVFANLITRFFIWLIEGTPIVVLLMILYYIIFGKVDIPGIWVAIIAFTLTFGAGFYGMLRAGTGALDRGQTEAAYALGFTDTQTFFTVILPQAALYFMPAYKSSVVALIKSTAIVGYIAVQDLTKMGDIVRSRTYEAFFPLIAVAAIYFVLAGLLNIIVGIIHNRIRPEKRTKEDILRGIDTHE